MFRDPGLISQVTLGNSIRASPAVRSALRARGESPPRRAPQQRRCSSRPPHPGEETDRFTTVPSQDPAALGHEEPAHPPSTSAKSQFRTQTRAAPGFILRRARGTGVDQEHTDQGQDKKPVSLGEERVNPIPEPGAGLPTPCSLRGDRPSGPVCCLGPGELGLPAVLQAVFTLGRFPSPRPAPAPCSPLWRW